MKTTLFALALVCLTACGSENTVSTAANDKDVLMHNDFDSLMGWAPDATSLSKAQAHSGQYSIKVDKGQEFSLNYTCLLGQLSPTRLRGVRLSAWAYLSNTDDHARWGFIVKDAAGGKELLNDGLDLRDQVKDGGKWIKISKEFIFPPAANYNSQLVMFLWGPGLNNPAYLDDIQLTALR